MPDRPSPSPVPEPLSRSAATRLLVRASELDAIRAADSYELAALRTAATEAGISERAFAEALAELQKGEPPRPPDVRAKRVPRWVLWTLALAGPALIAAALLLRLLAPAGGPTGVGLAMVDEAYYLRCLSGMDAAALTRPVLGLPQNTMHIRGGSRVLNIHATPEQHRTVKEVLDKFESSAASSCATAPASATPR